MGINENKRIIIGLIGIVAVITLMFLSNQHCCKGNLIKEENHFDLDFLKMHEDESHVLFLNKDSELNIDYRIERGIVDLCIENENTKIYHGNHLDEGHFSLEISEAGYYFVTVKGRNARGYVRIDAE